MRNTNGLNTDPGWRRDSIDTVVLRLVVRAAADERENFAVPWVERDQRRLGLAALAPRQQLVHAVKPARTASCATRCRCRSSVVYTSTGMSVVVVSPGYCSLRVWPTKSTKYGASASSARCMTVERLVLDARRDAPD